MACPAWPVWPLTDDTLTIRPNRPRIILGVARRMVWNAPVRLVWSTADQCSSDMRISSPSRVMPALFTRSSTGPKVSSIAPKAWSTDSGSATSACTASTSAPVASTAAWVSLAPSVSDE